MRPTPVDEQALEPQRGGLAAVVLAAGTSTRMSRFKPLLPFGGSTVLEHALAPFLANPLREVVVVVGHEADILRPVLSRLKVKCIENPDYALGMYSSLVTGLRALGPGVDAAFVLPADMPALRARTVTTLARARRRTDAPVILPTFRGRRGHPPLLSAGLFPAILAGTGEGGLRALLARLDPKTCSVPVLDEGVVLDLNTPDDYAAACKVLGNRSVPTHAECLALLSLLRVSPEVQSHGAVVAEVATRFSRALERAGVSLDESLVHAASLLHDIAKGMPDHAGAGARRLRRLGFPLVAGIVAAHTDLPACSRERLDEAAVVYLSDKLVWGSTPVALEKRFSVASSRRAESAEASASVLNRFRDAIAVRDHVEHALGSDAFARLVRDLPGATLRKERNDNGA